MAFLVQTFKKPRVSLSCQCSLERNIKSVFHFSSFDSSLNILTLAISPHTSGGSNTQMSQSLWCPTHTHTPVSHTALCVHRQNLSLPIPHTARSLFNVSDRLHQTNSSAPPRTYTLHGPPSMLLVISSVACMKIRDGKGDQTMNKWDSSCERRSKECREWIERGKEKKDRKRGGQSWGLSGDADWESPVSGLFSWLFGKGERGASLTSSVAALQPQRAFCKENPRLSLAFDPPGHAAVAAYRGRPRGADQVTCPPLSQLHRNNSMSLETGTHMWLTHTHFPFVDCSHINTFIHAHVYTRAQIYRFIENKYFLVLL